MHKDIYYHFITEKHRSNFYVKHRKMVKEKLINIISQQNTMQAINTYKDMKMLIILNLKKRRQTYIIHTKTYMYVCMCLY